MIFFVFPVRVDLGGKVRFFVGSTLISRIGLKFTITENRHSVIIVVLYCMVL